MPVPISLREIDHVVLRVRDLKAMERFYCDVLGAAFVAHRPDFNMTHLRAGRSLIDLVARAPGGEGASPSVNMDHLCLRVDPFDQEAIVAHLQRHGVAVGKITPRYGAEGNGPSIYLTDPEGNTVELKGPSDGKAPPLPRTSPKAKV